MKQAKEPIEEWATQRAKEVEEDRRSKLTRKDILKKLFRDGYQANSIIHRTQHKINTLYDFEIEEGVKINIFSLLNEKEKAELKKWISLQRKTAKDYIKDLEKVKELI